MKGLFFCGCHKRYVCRSGLWTHIKNKHQGIRPKGSYDPKKTGRPRKPDYKSTAFTYPLIPKSKNYEKGLIISDLTITY